MQTALFAPIAALVLGIAFASAQTPEDTYIEQTSGEVDTLDPAQAYDVASGAVLENIYETLYTYQGESVSEFEPLLATSYEVSEDGTVYSFTLREGVTFHSGNAMTCRDVEYSIERLLVTNPLDSAGWFFAESLLGVGANADAVLGEGATEAQYADYWRDIEASVTCPDGPDGLTVRFTLPAPDPAFFVKLMYTAASVVDSQWAIQNGMWDGTQATWREWVGVDLREHPLHTQASGTGAYQLVNWQVGDRVIAEAFEGYWGDAPEVETVQRQVVEDQSARILALQQGDADRISLNRSALAQVEGAPGVTVHEGDDWVEVAVSQLFFNQDIAVENNPDVGTGELGRGIPPGFFADPDMRKCIAYSFDQEVLIQDALQGEGVMLTMGLPPSYLGYDPDLPVYTADMEKAEKACRAAHGGEVWEKGFSFTATHTVDDTLSETAFAVIKANLESLNPKFRMNVRGLIWPEFLGMLDEGRGTLFTLGWAPDYADPDNFLYTYYASDGIFSSHSNFADAEMDALLKEARTTTDESGREALYRQVGARAFELVPMVPLPASKPFLVTRADLSGVSYNPMRSGSFLWKDLSEGE